MKRIRITISSELFFITSYSDDFKGHTLSDILSDN